MTEKRGGATYTQMMRASAPPDFRLTSGHFMKVKRSFWIPKIGKPCWFIQITPKTTINHLPFAYCSPVAQTHVRTVPSTT